MRVLFFDPLHGAAGDMVTGALLDCGADQSLVMQAMRSVVGEPTISIVDRAGIRAVHVVTHAGPAPRTLEQVLAIVRTADAPEEAIRMAEGVYHRIHTAESAIHGDHAHFHEVGADDAIADVLGACTALHSLHLDGVVILPVLLGTGTVEGAHGRYPLPAPATLALIEDGRLEVRFSGEEGETCTPTGAALLAAFQTISRQQVASFRIERIGYGAGTRNPDKTPNVLRVMLVETGEATPGDTVDLLETNVDDVTGEVLANTLSHLIGAGARDASAAPLLMKKGRAGYLIRVVCSPDMSSALARVMAEELGTLGVRCSPLIHRFVAERAIEQVTTRVQGEERTIEVKIGRMAGKVYSVKAEFDQVATWANDLGVPVRIVARQVEEAAWQAVRRSDDGV
jgi:uncharacterized protein (TIGR00299 family) protein